MGRLFFFFRVNRETRKVTGREIFAIYSYRKCLQREYESGQYRSLPSGIKISKHFFEME